jgi:hypothetical protein
MLQWLLRSLLLPALLLTAVGAAASMQAAQPLCPWLLTASHA